MQLFALRHETPACERIGVLATYQASELATASGLDDLQARAVSGRPHKLLVESGHQLAVVVEYHSCIADEDRSVPDAADAVVRALVKTYMGEDAMLSAGLLECAHLLAVDQQAFARESGEEIVVVDGSGDGCLRSP